VAAGAHCGTAPTDPPGANTAREATSSEATQRTRTIARMVGLPLRSRLCPECYLCVDSDASHSEGFPEPSWDDVLGRRDEWEPWVEEHLVVDSMREPDENAARALEYLRSR
jgi:hypothetical protein